MMMQTNMMMNRLSKPGFSNKPPNSTTTTTTTTSSNIFDKEHRHYIFHGVAKVGSIVSHSTSLQAQMTLWESEIKSRKHTFGCDVFDIMSRNRKAGEGTGGETEAQVVEIFADAVTDIHFLIDTRQQKQTDLIKATKLLKRLLQRQTMKMKKNHPTQVRSTILGWCIRSKITFGHITFFTETTCP